MRNKLRLLPDTPYKEAANLDFPAETTLDGSMPASDTMRDQTARFQMTPDGHNTLSKAALNVPSTSYK